MYLSLYRPIHFQYENDLSRRVWRYQRGNQNPYIEEEQTTQWPREKGKKDKQRSTKQTHKTKMVSSYLPLIYIFLLWSQYGNQKSSIEERQTMQWPKRTKGHTVVFRRPAETVSLQRRQICYRWGAPAYWSLVSWGSMFYLFEFCLKNMWNCSLRQQILSHSFYDWKLCELFLLSGFLICHAVGWYIELKNQRFWWWRLPEWKILI